MALLRSSLLAVAALAFLRIVVGMHFFLEGMSHLRDPNWSSAGFRKAAVGPLAEQLRAGLPQTGNWSTTLGLADDRPVDEVAGLWKQSVIDSWKKDLETRCRVVPLEAAARAGAEKHLATAEGELTAYLGSIDDSLTDYRLQVQRLAEMERSPASSEVPFARDRVTKKRRELSGQAAGWMNDVAAIGVKLTGAWNDGLKPADQSRVAAAAVPTSLWKTDRFVSWSLMTIGACLVLGLLVPFNAMGGVCFLASVIAAQPFWVPGAQATYDQWVELAALLVLAAMPIGGWSGIDYFLRNWCAGLGCCGLKSDEVRG